MSFNLTKALKYLQKGINKRYPDFDFEYGFEDDCFKAVATGLTLKGIDDDIFISIRGYRSGGIMFTLIFDTLPLTARNLDLVNTFNEEDPYFKAYISEEKNYLKLENFHLCYEESEFESAVGEFFARVVDLNEDKNFVKLASLTE